MKKVLLISIVAVAMIFSEALSFVKNSSVKVKAIMPDSLVHFAEEKHLSNIKQLTFGGDNAEAYFSFDNTQIVWQKTNPKEGIECDRIYSGNWNDLSSAKLISTGTGRTTCSYFLPGNKEIIYASTHLAGKECPPVPDRKKTGKYLWAIYAGFDIFIADLTGKIKKQLTFQRGYDAEATVSPKGDKIVFTSMRSGDLELYTMNIDGTHVTQITNELGYDGGAFFSPDGTKIVFRASRPKTAEEIKEYKELLAQNLVAPSQLELFICNADGTEKKQITKLGGANWAPFFLPSGKKVIFASNHAYPRGFPFNLYTINTDGTGLEKITHDGIFDAFPMFSFDGKKLIFSSNRNNGGGHDTNLFIADWVE